MTTEEIMLSFPITRKAWIQAGLIWSGIAISCDKSTVDGGTIRSEKVLKFNRKAMKELNKATVEKVDPRYNGGEDTMILKVGKPGSDERKAALAEQYAAILASGEEVSPFGWDDENMRKAVEDNNMSMEEYNSLPYYGGNHDSR
jgi:hypothetical protein